ncbi:MAG TPA: isoprenoid biosynthesis glyoxalase ElbB [Phycisphaerae bacterium]|nr:isoprenoid biosynthesis glyoxalase ElbB [Phycisphaerae bacterium]
MARVAVCLSGCGFLDGSEIHEAVFTLLALDRARAEIVCCAPDKPQADVIDHRTQKPVPDKRRNVLTESARIARGEIKPLSAVRAGDIDALIFPGGFGAAKNLCTFARNGPDCTVDPQVESLVKDMVAAGKPIGAICIAPAMLARIVGKQKIKARLTVGSDPQTAAAINRMGATHCECPTSEMVADAEHKLVSTPAYMTGKGPADVCAGIEKLVAEVLRMVG